MNSVAGTGTSRKAMEVLPFIPLGAVGSAEPGSGEWESALLNSTNETTSTDPVSWKRVIAEALPPCCQQRERKEKGRKERKGGKREKQRKMKMRHKWK